MKKKTKMKRLTYVLDIMRKTPNQDYTLTEWLSNINVNLPSHYAFSSTKQLAKAFQYIGSAFNQELVKSRKYVTSKDLTSCNIYYKAVVI
jgi:hypothetical protein